MTDLELQQLFTAFSAGRTPQKQDFNASRMFTLLEDPFSIWCGFHAPPQEAVSEPNRYENLKIRTDRSARDAWIRQEFPSVLFISAASEEQRFKATLTAMAQGERAIANAALWNLDQHVYGSVNLLVRQDTAPSRFGNYHYVVYQFKRAYDLKEHYRLQVALLTQILGEIQQYTPADALLCLKEHWEKVDFAAHRQRLNEELIFWNNIRTGLAKPQAHKPPKAASAPWRVYANRWVTQNKDLVLLPHLNIQMRQFLKINGLFNTDDVAKVPLEKLQTILEEPYATETHYNALAYWHNKPILRQEGHFPPPSKKHNLYFDFEATETFTKENKSFVYLIGLWDKEQDKYVTFVAKTPEEEISIFEQFYNYIQDFEDTILFHWTEYEVRKMKTLAGVYPQYAEHLNKLCSLCYDLKVCVNNAFYLPAPSFSLKAVAPIFGFNWRQDDCGAMDSMVYFTSWLKTGDESLLHKIFMYNEDDCKAMLVVENALKQAEILNPASL